MYAERVVAGAVILLAAYLRFVALNDGQWRNDEEIIWLHALRAVAARRFPWVGIPSDLGLANGPGQMLPVLPAALLQSPYIAYVLVASLNILAVAALYRLGRLWGGAPLGLAAAAIAATSPWAVIHSRRLWGNDMLAPFAVLFVTALWQFAAQRRRWRIVEAAAWLALLLQMYVAAVVHLAVLLLGLLLAGVSYGRRATRQLTVPCAAALALLLLLIAGYSVTALLPHGSDLFRAIHDPRSDTPAAVGIPNWSGFPYLVQTVGMDGYQYYLQHAAQLADTTSGIARVETGLADALFFCGVVALLLQIGLTIAGRSRPDRQQRGAAAALLLTWTLALPVALIVHNAPVCACFLLPSYPAQYLVVAVGALAVGQAVTWAVQRRRHPLMSVTSPAKALGTSVSGVLVTLIVLSQLGAALPFFGVIGRYWPDDRYGLPFAWHRRIVDAVAQAWRPGMAIVVSGHGELDGVLRDEIDTRLPGVHPRLIDDQRWLALPGTGQQPMLVLVTPGASPAHEALATFAQREPAARRGAVTVPGAGVTYQLVAVTAADVPALDAILAPPASTHPINVRFAQDVTLDRFVFPARLQPGQSTPVRLEWTTLYTAPRIPADSYYVHLISATGAAAALLDAPFLPPGLWRQGERVWTFGNVSDPGGNGGLRSVLLGLYMLRGKSATAGVIALPAVDAAGHSLHAIRVGPVVVRAADIGAATSPIAPDLAPGVSLVGADVPALAHPGTPLAVTLHWQATTDYPPRYTAFIHLVNANGALLAQQDGEPDDGSFPTSTWLNNERINDLHAIPLPATLPPGVYRLVIGVYPTGQPDKPHALTWPQPVTVR